MIDVSATIYTSLLAQTALTSIIGTRIWPDRATPLEGYAPTSGPSIAFRIRGGDVLYRGSMASASVQFKCYGVDEKTAHEAYRALYDVLHDKQPGAIRGAFIEQLGQLAEDQGTGWFFVLAFFTIWLQV